MNRRPSLEWSDGAAGPLLQDARELAWQDAAACQYTDPEAFFPADLDEDCATAVQADRARRVCLGCPVREQCLSYALGTAQQWGIWAGLSERELRRERLRSPRRAVREILADSDARYFRRQDTAIAAQDRRLAAERRRRAEAAALTAALEAA